jgi:NodT family efflux transporter outer membrane factor (OMF) lipoprotein
MDGRTHTLTKALILLLECCLLFSACTVTTVQNRENIPDTFPEHYPTAGNTISEHRFFWEQSFPSQSLRNDILTLLDKNFELAAARARVEQAAAVYGTAISDLMPTLNGQGEFERSRVKEDNSTTNQSTITFEAALNWELDIWGRLKARRNAAALSFQEQQAKEEQAMLDLQTLLVESWIIHHGAHKLEEVLVAQRTTNKQFLNLTALRLALGEGSALDVLRQRALLVTTRRALPEVVSQKRCAANAYAVLLGHLPDGRDLAHDTWPTLERITALTSPRQLLMDRPDLRTAFLALQAADHEVAAAIADRLPRFSIGLSYEATGSRISTIGRNTAINFVSGLLAPIFDGGRFKANVAKRKAEVRELLALLEHAMLVAVQEVEDAFSQEYALFDQYLLIANEIDIAVDVVEKARLRYASGQDTYLVILTALADLQALQKDEITLQQELLLNRSRLLKALGAKWDPAS